MYSYIVTADFFRLLQTFKIRYDSIIIVFAEHFAILLLHQAPRCFYLRHGGFVFVGASEFVSQQHQYRTAQKTVQPIFTPFGGTVENGPRKKPIDFGDIRITLRQSDGCGRLGVTVTVKWGQRHTSHGRILPGVCINSNFFATSAAALGQVCALLSDILISSASVALGSSSSRRHCQTDQGFRSLPS